MILDNDNLKIHLSTRFHHDAPHIKAIVNGNKIFDKKLTEDYCINYDANLGDKLQIVLEKTGKNKNLVDKGFKQEVIIKKLSLNGCDQHADKFGVFEIKNNPYVKNKKIQTNKLFLNGTWNMQLPIFRQPFFYEENFHKKMQDKFKDTEIACFGCSFTYGDNLDRSKETWPKYLEKITNTEVKNYGLSGSCISTIISCANEYTKRFECKKLIILLPHPCRLQVQDTNGKFHTLLPWHSPDIEKMFSKISRDIALYGEDSVLFAGYVTLFQKIINKMSKKTKIFISAYDKNFYGILESLENKNFEMLPFYQVDKKYKLASDNRHPGPEHNRFFAESIVQYVNGKD